MDPDFDVRLAAIDQAQALQDRYTDVIPRAELLKGVVVAGERYALLNPQSGIHRPRRFHRPAALTIVTAVAKPNAPPLYEDDFDEENGTIFYSYRQGPIDSPDNRALRAAFTEQVPLTYLMGVAPAFYSLSAPIYVVEDRPAARGALVQIGSRATDLSPAGMRSDVDVRRYALRETRYRLHQHRFRHRVLTAYRHRCTICASGRSSRRLTSSATLTTRALRSSATVSRSARSITWPTTATSWGSTQPALSRLPRASSTSRMDRCSRPAFRAFTASAS